MKKFKICLLLLAFLLVLTSCASENEPTNPETPTTEESGNESGESGKVMLYSSLKEEQLQALKEGFEDKYPDITMDYYAAGTSKVATKMATEAQSGQIATDVVWIGDPSNYVTFKEQGILEAYESPEAETIDEKFKDPDNMFTGARLVIMGLTTNTNSVPDGEEPTTWKDLLDPTYKDQIVMTDPGESGTTFYLVASLINHPDYGIEFFEQLKEQGTELESGTTSTHTKVAANAYKVAIGVDYVTQTLEAEGSTVRFTYPEQDLIAVSSPIALVKNSPNPDNGKLLFDFILSVEGQEILAANDTTPIRPEVTKEGSMSLEKIVERAMIADDEAIAEQSTDLLQQFDEIFK